MDRLSKADKITNIAVSRGFFFPTAEIYGSKAGFWTYGHLGTLVKSRWEKIWRETFLNLNDNYYEIEGNYILPEKVFQSSGHLDHFNDPLTDCKKCNFRFRADELIEDELKINAEGLDSKAMDKLVKENKLKCPRCGSDLGKVKWFNMMFDVKIGVTGEDLAYLSPETAQNPYLSFKREFNALREKLPMGLAMVGKAFRNEISPRKGFFRLREFTQAELQIFFDPDNIDEVKDWTKLKNYKVKVLLVKNRKKGVIEESCENLNKKFKIPKFFVYHLAEIQKFYLNVLKIPKNKFRFREFSEKERSFYNKIHFDVELDLETIGGFKEVAGLHLRGNHDLESHERGSKEKLKVNFDGKEIIPNVLELSFGVDRNIWALLDIFYKEEKDRVLFSFPSSLVPFDAAVFPLVRNKTRILKKSQQVYDLLKKEFDVFYDEKDSVGRRYRRIDEVGVPVAITIDFDTLKDDSITIRDRDSMKQIRVKIKDLNSKLREFISGKRLARLGKVVK